MQNKIVKNLEQSVENLRDVEHKLKEILAILRRIAAMKKAQERGDRNTVVLSTKIAAQFHPLGACTVCGEAILFRDNDGEKSLDLCVNNHEIPSHMTKLSVETPTSH